MCAEYFLDVGIGVVQKLLNKALKGDSGDGKEDERLTENFRISIYIKYIKSENMKKSGFGFRANAYPGEIRFGDIISSELRERRPRSRTVISGTLPLKQHDKANRLRSFYKKISPRYGE